MIKASTLAIALAFASSAALAQSADPAANSPVTVTNGAAANVAVAPVTPETSLPAASDSAPMPEVSATPAATAVAVTTAPPAAAASVNTQVAATADYPVCSRTVVDKCINRGANKHRRG